MIRGLLVAALFLSPLPATGQGWYTYSVFSEHLVEGNHCEFNPGIGIEHGTGALRGAVGIYKNSGCKKMSIYFGLSYTPFQWGQWRLGGAAILVSGYNESLLPAPGLKLAYEPLKGWGGDALWFPNGEGDFKKGVIGFRLKRMFK